LLTILKHYSNTLFLLTFSALPIASY